MPDKRFDYDVISAPAMPPPPPPQGMAKTQDSGDNAPRGEPR